MSNHDGAVYIDSPITAAVRQVAPFFTQGVFSNEHTPMIMRKRVGSLYGLMAPKAVAGVDIRTVSGEAAKKLPVRRDGAVFYPFNGQGNLHTVANRSYRHVLVLHGESNKRASARPAARLYDYVCVAGNIAVDRYLAAGIFRKEDVDQGRLIRTGDTFIQSMQGCVVDPAGGDHILYAPTWEGYGGRVNDHSTISTFGFDACLSALDRTGRDKIVIRPHPYLGMLSQKMASDFWRGVLRVSECAKVCLDVTDSNMLIRAAACLLVRKRPGRISLSSGAERVSFALCDLSAMEAICLKEGLPHFVLLKNFQAPERIAHHYAEKSSGYEGLSHALSGYLENAAAVDAAHRADAFAVSHEDFNSSEGSRRLRRLFEIAASNPFWRSGAQ